MYRINMVYTIKTLSERGYSQRAIAKELKISRKTVRKYLKMIELEGVKEPTIYKSKILDSYHESIIKWIENGLSAQLIHDKLIQNYSLRISYPTVARFVRELRDKHKEVFIPMISQPGEEAQVDYGYVGKFLKDGKLTKIWCFVMTLSYSRYQYVEMVTNQSVNSFLSSHIRSFEFFTGVPKTVKIDNLKAGVITADFYQSTIQTQYAEFLSHYNTAPITARVRRPQDKGKVESGVKYVKNNFIKGLESNDFETMQKELVKWLEKSNQRTHGTTKKVPFEIFSQTEKSTLIPLVSKRFEIYKISKRKANNYAHIVFGNNYYSVPAKYVNKELDIKYTDTILRVFDNTQEIAMHTISKATGEYVTQEHHKPIEKQYKNKEHYIDKCKEIGINAVLFAKELIIRKPYDYQKAINGICHLSRIHGKQNVEQACERALTFSAFSYLTIKNICQKLTKQDLRETLSVINTGGFYNDLSTYDQLNSN